MFSIASGVVALVVGISSQAAGTDPRESVVQVTAELRLPNPVRPWLRQNAITVAGSGVVIDGERILTNAHLIAYATDVWVQAGGGDDRQHAKVVGCGPDIDLAVLELDDPSFFEAHPPLPRADKIPQAMSAVTVYGFPIGANGLSVTQGIISRVAYAERFSGIAGVILQVDAALNPGNSGGPALVGGRMVGIASSRLNQGENIGYIIPNEEIDLFLEDIADGSYRGKPSVGFSVQTAENPALRDKLKLDRSIRGLMISRLIPPEKPCPVQPFDILTRIGPKQIDNQGMVSIDDGMRLPFHAVASRLECDGTVPVSVIRDGTPLEIQLSLDYGDDFLIPSYKGAHPTYFVCGPFVFSPAREEAVAMYLRMKPALYYLDSPLCKRTMDRVAFEGEELVVITAPMLPHRITRDYTDPFGQVVESINHTKIKNLRHLVETLRDCEDPFLVFKFADNAETLVFHRQEFLDATEEAMLESGIPRQGNDDVLAVWRERKAAP